MSTAPLFQPISVHDYLDGERLAKHKHEYVDGRVYLMAGATNTHNLPKPRGDPMRTRREMRI